MSKPRKIYDFSEEKVQQQLVTALRRNQGSATVADLISLSGLPKFQVESMLPVVVDECRGQMQVTASGDILYRFPKGLTNQARGASATWKRILKRFLTVSAKILTWLFKAWIVVMLLGYFALFVLILLAAVVISIALSFAKRGEDRDDSGGGILGFYLVTRVFEFFLLLWLYSGDTQIRDQKKKKPFFKAVFEFVFGVEEKPEVRERAQRKAVIAWLQEHKGSITLEELRVLTGAARQEADRLVSRLLLELEGQPLVSDEGTLYFFFPEVLRTTKDSSLTSSHLAEAELIPFTRNPSKTNQWIGFLNGFNLVLSAYFLGFGSLGFEAIQGSGDALAFVYQLTVVLLVNFTYLGLASAEALIAVVLGIVPAAYSAFFFGIPLVRRWREKQRNELRKTENFRRKVLVRVFGNPLEIRLEGIEPDSERNAPGKPGPEREALKERMLRDVADSRSLEVQSTAPLVYQVPDFLREKNDMVKVRAATDTKAYRPSEVIFDTEKRLE